MQAWSGDLKSFSAQLECAAGAEERMKLLEAENQHGWNALHFSAVYGREEMMEVLLSEAPQLVQKANLRGWRPLHYASGFGHSRMIDLLLRHGAELSCENEISIAHLLHLGADPTALDAHGRTPVDLVSDPCCAPAALLLSEAAAAGHAAAEMSRQSEATRHRLAHRQGA